MPRMADSSVMVLDKSGKVVKTVSSPNWLASSKLMGRAQQSKHLMNVFKEAKSAYRERKAEIVAQRHVDAEERRVRHQLEGFRIEEDARSGTSRGSARHAKSKSRSHARPSASRVNSGGSARSSSIGGYPASRGPSSYAPSSPHREPGQELVRRHTMTELAIQQRRPAPSRSMTTPTSPIDMDLAYGELPPNDMRVARVEDEVELKTLVSKVKMLLEEADCAHKSVTAVITHLQKNPDAMAAITLTLAEISNIATKLAPGALTALKGTAPAVFALLAAPEFLIGTGVALGITVVALGGYKIVKRIRAKKAAAGEAEAEGVDEMVEITEDLSRIEHWRRGIAEVEASSAGTSVDGEFITPKAAVMSGYQIPRKPTAPESRAESKSSKSVRSSSKAGKESSKRKSSRSSSAGSSTKLLLPGEKKEKKEKKPSPLRLMFK